MRGDGRMAAARSKVQRPLARKHLQSELPTPLVNKKVEFGFTISHVVPARTGAGVKKE